MSAPETKKISAEGIYLADHEVLPAIGDDMPEVVSRIYRVFTGGDRELIYSETRQAEELVIFIIEGRRLVLYRQDMDRSYGPCECDQVFEEHAYLALDLDNPTLGLEEIEPTPAIEMELQARYETCQRRVQEEPICNE